MTAHSHTTVTVVLETFQTYHAIFRAVNPLAGSTGAQSAGAESKRATCRSSWPSYLNQRAKAPERSNSLKNLYWRFRDSANLSENSVPDFQPCGQGSYSKLYVLDAGFSCGTQIRSHIRRRQECLLLTLLLYRTQTDDATPD